MCATNCVEVPSTEWKNLEEIFKTNWPHHCLPYINIQNYGRLIQNEDVKIYCLNGDWSDGTIILKANKYNLYLISTMLLRFFITIWSKFFLT